MGDQSSELIGHFLDNGILPGREELTRYIQERWNIEAVPDNIYAKIKKDWDHFANINILQQFILDSEINEVIIHSNHCIQYEKHGQLVEEELHHSTDRWQHYLARYLALKAGISWNYSEPFQSFYFVIANEKFRVTLLHQSLNASDYPKISLRRHKNTQIDLDLFNLEAQIKTKLNQFVLDKKNILICGSTGSGKTTFMRALISPIKDEHLISIEDTHELITSNPTHSCLIASKTASLVDLCAYSLRLRPDRILLGEIRGQEIIPFFMSMNTGHKGLMSTIHASSGSDALKRAALLFSLFSSKGSISMENAMKLICQNIDYVVHLKDKAISEIIQVHGVDSNEPMITNVSV